MKVIAICEHGNEWPIAVVEIPTGLTKDETFVKWFRQHPDQKNKFSDQEILEESVYLWQELTVQKI